MTKRVAVIGAGGMGRFHASVLQDIPAVEVGAVCDLSPDIAERAAREFGVPVRTDPQGVAAEGWAGVVIATPDETHADLTLLALAAGSRVLCEKPLADDLAGARAVVDHEVAIGERRVQVGFMRVFDREHMLLAERLTEPSELHYLRCTHRNTNADARPPAMVIVQSLIHDIHTVQWLAGAVVDVDARTIPRPGGLLHVLLVLGLASGATATLEFSDNTCSYGVEVEATSDHGIVKTSAPPDGGDQEASSDDDWFARFSTAYRLQDRAWVESLADVSGSGPSAWDGLNAQLVTEAALESMASGSKAAVARIDRPELYSEGLGQ